VLCPPARSSPPPRADVRAAALVLVVVGLYAASGPLPSSASPVIIGALVVATLIGVALRTPYAVHAGLLTAIYLGVYRLPRVGGLWPLPLFLIIGAYATIAHRSTWLRASSGWLRRGRLDRTSIFLIAIFVSASAIALIMWRFWTNTDLTRFRSFVPNVPRWTIPFGIVAYAVLNAAFEETIWRGVLMHALEAAVGRGRLAWLLQGIGFGLWHYAGFPGGWVGVSLATIFALMMGELRARSRGMLAPFVAHVFADVTIFLLVAAMVLG
jgi:uncharacterized protein